MRCVASTLPFSVSNMSWSGKQRALVVKCFFQNGESPIKTQRALRTTLGLGRHDPVPSCKTIKRWVDNFNETGSTEDKKRSGRPLTARTPENVEAVRNSFLKSPHRSAKKHASALGLSDRSVRRILHLDLKFHPYKMAKVQELLPRDQETRVESCRRILDTIPVSAFLLTSDEAHFHLCGTVNKQNMRYWAPENPHEIHQSPLHSLKVTVWCAVSRFGVIGPYFFEERGQTVTVTSDRYVAMLRDFFQPRLAEFKKEIDEEGLDEVWFQQDGATAHTATRSMALVRELFPARAISRRGDINWPPRSPDLAPCDFFLWGHLKAEVYKHRPKNLEELKAAIIQEIAAIPREMTERAMRSFRFRLQACITNEGRHMPEVVYHT